MKLYWYKNDSGKYNKLNITLSNFSSYRLNKIKEITNNKLKHEQIVSELLLQKVLIKNNLIDTLPLLIKVEKNNKPYIEGLNLNYSNSHSNNFFGVVLSKNLVSIDIEHKKRFSEIISKRWKIKNKREFITKYTIYESLMKLLNDDVYFDLIIFNKTFIEYKNKTYYFKTLKRKSYLITVLSLEKFELKIKQVKKL